MANNISESSKKTNATERASSSGKMAECMKEAGLKVNNQERGILQNKEKQRKAFGWMAYAKSGLMNE